MKGYILLLSLTCLVMSEVIQLPAPKKSGGQGLNEVVNKRISQRNYHDDETGELTLEEVSQLLWAGYGPNRENGFKTVPSAVFTFPFDLYVFMKKGIYIYHPNSNELELFKAGDYRKETGGDAFVKNAYMNICMVGSYDKVYYMLELEKKQYSMRLDVGFVGADMYLACSDMGIQCVSRANINQNTIFEVIGLSNKEYYIPLCFSASR